MKGAGWNMTKQLTTINPATEEVINTYDIATKEQIKEKTKKARNAHLDWKKDMNKRADHIHDLAHELSKNKEELARKITQEMGKAIKEARAEVDKCAWVMEYYADNGKILVNEEVINTDARKSTIVFEPIGVIGSIMPWNFPYWQALRFAAPSLMVGNTIVLKPASATMGCGLEIEKAFSRSGVPDGVFQTVVLDGAGADVLIDSEDVNAVTFTGSVIAGGKVAQRATSQIKKCVLELGGSDEKNLQR
jgi:acyl-CoA reductase-like NAD-dependent aldehyde dehydrogenase